MRFVSWVGLVTLVACGGTATATQVGLGTGASGEGEGDGIATHAEGGDAAAPFLLDASASEASSASTTATASADDASKASDSPFDGDGNTDGAGSDTSIPNSGASCDYVVDTAPVVVATYASGPMPPYTKGGTIADGTYWLTSIVLYAAPGATAPTYKETVEVFGTSWNNIDAYMGITRQATETLAVQGASGTLMYTCDSLNDPVLLQKTVSFTFEVDGATLLLADATDGYSLTYVRQDP